MNAEIKQKWIVALRSGKYQQGFNRLRSNDKYCCLGVLCDLSGLGWWEDDDYLDTRASLPSQVIRLCDLHREGDEVSVELGPLKKTLSSLNDAGFTFDQIADIVEYAL